MNENRADHSCSLRSKTSSGAHCEAYADTPLTLQNNFAGNLVEIGHDSGLHICLREMILKMFGGYHNSAVTLLPVGFNAGVLLNWL
jgi:hypothetical protein